MTSVLVVAEFFPTIIQPWLLNSIEQICLRGRATVAASAPGLGPVPKKVEALELLKRTLYCPMTGGRLVRRILRPDIFLRMVVHPAFWRGLAILGIPLSDSRAMLKHIGLAQVVGFDRYNIIHAHHEINAYEFLPVARALNIPLVLTFHGKPPPGVAELSMEKRKVLFKSIAHVQVNTQFAATQVIALGCAAEKIRILPQGTDLKDFPFCPRPPVCAGEPLVILTVARIQSDKGHKYAIEAVANLVRAGHNIEYRIVGAGPEEVNLRAQINALGMQKAITMLGPLTDMKLFNQYRQAHVFVLPSLRDLKGMHEETQGVVIQEAQATGNIVIATKTGGVSECVESGTSAFLVEDRSASAIEAAILRILRQPDNWKQWQEKARQWVESRFDINIIGNLQWDLYQQAIVEDKARASLTPLLGRSH